LEVTIVNPQGPDAVHIQQVGQRELRRAPGLVQKAAERKKKEAVLFRKAGIKAHL
jgi:acyl-CoA dehydrogenase